MSKVLCVGELLVDFICTNKGSGLEDGTDFIKKAGGAPANVSVAIAKMGAHAYMSGCVGNDPFGAFLENTLKKHGVNVDNIIKSDEYNTTLAFVSLQKDGERHFFFNRGADREYSFASINPQVLEACTIFHFGSATAFLGGELEKTYDQLLKYAIKNNKIIIFDPNYREDFFKEDKQSFIDHCKYFIKRCDLLKVSGEEAILILGDNNLENAAKTFCEAGAKYTLITLGKDGVLLSDGKNTIHIESESVEMVDATGAGDAFIGAVIARIADNNTSGSEIELAKLMEYVRFGCKVGAMTVKKYGAMESIPYLSELE